MWNGALLSSLSAVTYIQYVARKRNANSIKHIHAYYIFYEGIKTHLEFIDRVWLKWSEMEKVAGRSTSWRNTNN